MHVTLEELISTQAHMGCFGHFNIEDSICRQDCVLSIRCAIEKEQSSRVEMLEEWLATEQLSGKVQ